MCGSYDNPDPLLFIEVYRLRSLYCLVKPIKGSNVEGIELFNTLLHIKEDETVSEKSRKEWEGILEQVVANNANIETDVNDPSRYHEYNIQAINDKALAYVAGFVARKVQNWTKCEICKGSAVKEEGGMERDRMIDSLNRGYLKYPSEELYQLLFAIETAIMKTTGSSQICTATFQIVSQNILKEKIHHVGCKQHENELTKRIIHYYTIMRAKIICKKHNSIFDDAKQKEKSFRKLSKLVGDVDKVGKKKS